MRSWQLSLVAVAVLAASAVAGVGCGSNKAEDEPEATDGGGGGDGGTGAGSVESKDFFVKNVHPVVDPTCGSCHATGDRGAPVYFAPKDPEASYRVLEGFPGIIAPARFSPFVQKGIHSGPALTSQQVEVVTKWLDLEASSRKLGGQPRFPNARVAFTEIANCMSYDKWLAAGISAMAATSTDIGPCSSCHSTGYAGFYASGDPKRDFEKAREFPNIQRFVSGTVDDLGAFDRAVYSNRYVKKPLLIQNLALNHPMYTPTPRIAAAMELYFQDVIRETERTFQRGEKCVRVELPAGDAGPDAR